MSVWCTLRAKLVFAYLEPLSAFLESYYRYICQPVRRVTNERTVGSINAAKTYLIWFEGRLIGIVCRCS